MIIQCLCLFSDLCYSLALAIISNARRIFITCFFIVIFFRFLSMNSNLQTSNLISLARPSCSFVNVVLLEFGFAIGEDVLVGGHALEIKVKVQH